MAATTIASTSPSELSPSHDERGRRTVARFAWGVLAWNLVVIAWGAFVRASGSGAGCGKHWPLCNGEVVPRPQSIATVIEASHRATSGLALVLVVAMTILAFRRLPSGHPSRRAAVASTVFIFGEALIGAALVLFELVAHDASLKRGLSMILHLGNTFLLLAALVVTAWCATVPHVKAPADVRPARETLVRAIAAASLLALLVLGASGAIAALGDTLFPARSLREGFAQDLSPLAHVFLRLRVMHPFLALAAGAVVFAASSATRLLRPSPRVRVLARVATVAFAVQFAAGLLNVTLLAPVPMQLVHLLLADVTWLALVLLAWEAVYGEGARLARGQSPIMSRNGPAPTSDVPPSTSNVDPVT